MVRVKYDNITHSKMDYNPELCSKRLLPLVDGLHRGCCEKRQKCAGQGEFDGQSSFIWVPFLKEFLLLTRANRARMPPDGPGGWRGVQGALGVPLHGSWKFKRFVQIRFPEVPDHANVYFAHPYMLNAGVLALVFPLA